MNNKKKISLIFANRNRDAARIRTSFTSLKKQNLQNFEVILVDYGSDFNLVQELFSVSGEFNFVRFYNLEVSQLLWNKSKAINYGILKAKSPYIFIADVDLIFHPEATGLFEKLLHPRQFYLFRLSYLSKKNSQKIKGANKFDKLGSSDYNDVNGMLLAPLNALMEVNGLDEFFHFYGGEDEDLYARLENAGYSRKQNLTEYYYHIWHPSFSGSEDNLLTGNPRMKNIRRINERHYERNRGRKINSPLGQSKMGEIISKEESQLLKTPDVILKIPNILGDVEHVLREELTTYPGKIVEIYFFKDPYERSFMFYIKKFLRKRTEVYCTMKTVNDMVLKEILYMYRDTNYSFKIAEDLRSITFCIKL